MEIQKSTLKLIQSMTMNEKRHFKMLYQKNGVGGQSKYILLFDIINKHQTINEELLKKKIQNYDFSDKNISYDVNYLHKILLRSLNDFHYGKTINLKIKENLKSIEILFYKGLYEECLKLIKKTKKISLKNENEYLMLDLLNWEKKCVGYSSGFFAAQLINDQIDIYFKAIKNYREITDIYYQSYFLKNSVGKNSLQKTTDDFEKLLQNKLIINSSKELTSIQPIIYTNLIYSNYYHVLKNKKQEVFYLEKAIDVFNTNDDYKKENPLDYISIFNRIIDIYKNNNDEIFHSKIEELRSFENILDFQKEVTRERIFIHTYQAELDFLIHNDQNDLAHNTMIELIDKLKKNKFNIEPYYLIGIYYQIGCIYLLKNNLSKSLKFTNQILNEFKIKDRPNSFIKTEILNIIIHFNFKNYKLVLYNIENYNKKYKRVFKLNFIEKNLIKTIQKISENPFSFNENNEFNNLYKKIIKKEPEQDSVSNKIYLKLISNKINTN